MNNLADVLIMGGAVVGSAVAYFLASHPAFSGRVVVLERDPTYARSATALSLASIRHQFSTALNVQLSQFGTQFIRQATERLCVDGEAPDLSFHEGGYLFLASEAGEAVLRQNQALQRSLGADVILLSAAQMNSRWPWLNTQGLALGSFGQSGEGWLDAYGLMMALRRKAQSLGVTYVQGEVVALQRHGRRVLGATLADGKQWAAGTFVNTAGTGATALAAAAGIHLPVHARKRCVFHLHTPAVLPGCPLVIDPSGVYFRPEGQGFLCGAAPPEAEDPDSIDFEVDWPMWEERLWPTLADRVPGLEAARVANAWAGHYDVNVLDHNAILGPHPDIDNLLFANGFSGHGLQQSPAVGRGLAEWIVEGRWRSLDLAPLGWQRVLDNRPLREINVV